MKLLFFSRGFLVGGWFALSLLTREELQGHTHAPRLVLFASPGGESPENVCSIRVFLVELVPFLVGFFEREPKRSDSHVGGRGRSLKKGAKPLQFEDWQSALRGGRCFCFCACVQAKLGL